MSHRSEAKTRRELIDPALQKAGWDVNHPEQVGIEIPVDGFDPAAWKALREKLQKFYDSGIGYTTSLPKGICDYVLYRPNGEIVAVVEAKRTSTDPRLAEAQSEFYVTELEKLQSFRPFAFMSNGYDTYFWDVGQANKRLVHGFFSPDDLDNLLYLRENGTPLTQVPVDSSITDRAYQQEAVRRVCEAFEQGRRRALLVMATGTGKTRVAMSLTDVFLRANQARRILFVADRDALVRQALTEGFEEHIPNEPCTRIYTNRIDTSNRLYVVTLQTLSNCFQEFTPAFFDLIIFDEAHRSIFNKWNEVLEYFDGRMIGLTATPADFIDRNTFLQFECEDKTPTFLYPYEQAIQDKYLVDYTLYAARTKFQRKGIRGAELTEEERNALVEQGIDPDDLDYAGTELEKKVSNRDTLRKQWQEIWEECLKDQSGQLPGKTIVFAMTQDHAQRLADVFEEMYPQYPGLSRVITCKSEYKGNLIEAFKKENLPRIAISVDMLETGVNVPEVVNLVFMRPVHSRIKLEQMIGRGTRTHETCTHAEWLPNGHKEKFLIVDFWDNNFAKEPQKHEQQTLPVLVRTFNTRIKLLRLLRDEHRVDDLQRTIADLRAQIALIPIESFSVKRLYPEVKQAWQDSFWQYLPNSDLDFLERKVGPLLRYAPAVDVQSATFTSKVERLKVQILTGADLSATVQSIAEDVSRLPEFVFEDTERKHVAQLCLTPDLCKATVAELNQVIDQLADQMRNRRERPSSFLLLDLPDYIEMRGYIWLLGGQEKVYVQQYRQRVEQRILDLAGRHPTIRRIERGKPVSDLELIELERTLRDELGSDLELSERKIRAAYGLKVSSLLEFLRELRELEQMPDYAEIVRRQFDEYIAEHTFNGNQIRFLRVVASVLARKQKLVLADLYEAPLTHFGHNAVDRWFTPSQVYNVLAFAGSLSVVGG